MFMQCKRIKKKQIVKKIKSLKKKYEKRSKKRDDL